MLTDERPRHEYLKLEALLGKPEADTLMAHLPPTTFADLATRRDLDIVSSVFRSDLVDMGASLRVEMAALRGDLKDDMAALRGELKGEMAALDQRLTGELSSLRTETRVGFADVRSEIARAQTATMKVIVATQVAGIISMAGIVVGALSLR